MTLLRALLLIGLVAIFYQNCAKMDYSKVDEPVVAQCQANALSIDDIRLTDMGTYLLVEALSGAAAIKDPLNWKVTENDVVLEYNNQSELELSNTQNWDADVQVSFPPSECLQEPPVFTKAISYNYVRPAIFEIDTFSQNEWPCPLRDTRQCSYINGHMAMDGYFWTSLEWATYDFTRSGKIGLIPTGNYKITFKVHGGASWDDRFQTGARGRLEVVKSDNSTQLLWNECMVGKGSRPFVTKTINYTGSIKALRFQSQKEACPGDGGSYPTADGEFITVDYLKIEEQ